MDQNTTILILAAVALGLAYCAYNKKELFQTAQPAIPKPYCSAQFPPIDFPVNDKWVEYCTGQCRDQGNVMPDLCPCLCAQGYSYIDAVGP